MMRFQAKHPVLETIAERLGKFSSLFQTSFSTVWIFAKNGVTSLLNYVLIVNLMCASHSAMMRFQAKNLVLETIAEGWGKSCWCFQSTFSAVWIFANNWSQLTFKLRYNSEYHV